VKVLIVGGGGREHALAWQLRRDDSSIELIAAPGNPGIAELGRCVNVAAADVDALAALAKSERVAWTMVGPEAPLDAGIVDRFRTEALPVFGPTKAAARIETSKSWAKALMTRAGVPTARAQVFSSASDARVAVAAIGAPVVIKATGLAAGKGVVVAQTVNEANDAIAMMLDGNAFGAAGAEVLVEEYMTGEELSLFVVTDGTHSLPMLAAQDHKRVGEGDTGPNTGGMGAYAPVALATPAVMGKVMDTIIEPTLRAMRDDGCPFTGLLYAGLMLAPEGPKVVEFNCRFGDPETEAVLPLLASSLADPLRAVAVGDSLAGARAFQWNPGAAVTTIVAAHGYPGTVRSGDAISIPTPLPSGVTVFHAGTKRDADGTLRTSGGRVLAVTAVGDTVAAAQRASRDAADSIAFAGKQFRRDIGWREMARARAS